MNHFDDGYVDNIRSDYDTPASIFELSYRMFDGWLPL